jgi:hypothetical protein
MRTATSAEVQFPQPHPAVSAITATAASGAIELSIFLQFISFSLSSG